MTVFKCNSCGFENIAGGNFCEKCGKSLSAEVAQSTFVLEQLTPLEDKYDNLKSISKFYKVIMIIVALIALFLAYKVYAATDSFSYAFVLFVFFLPINIMIGSQADKIDISISQEKSMRECAYYLKRLAEQNIKN